MECPNGRSTTHHKPDRCLGGLLKQAPADCGSTTGEPASRRGPEPTGRTAHRRGGHGSPTGAAAVLGNAPEGAGEGPGAARSGESPHRGDAGSAWRPQEAQSSPSSSPTRVGLQLLLSLLQVPKQPPQPWPLLLHRGDFLKPLVTPPQGASQNSKNHRFALARMLEISNLLIIDFRAG